MITGSLLLSKCEPVLSHCVMLRSENALPCEASPNIWKPAPFNYPSPQAKFIDTYSPILLQTPEITQANLPLSQVTMADAPAVGELCAEVGVRIAVLMSANTHHTSRISVGISQS